MSEKQLLHEGQILTGPLFSEPMRVETVHANGPDTWVAGLVGTHSERFRKVTLTSRDLESLTLLDARHTYDGDGRLLRLGLQAYSLGIAYEFDPYFGLSISRANQLAHQLEAVYDHLLKLPRIRFVVADDAGAGKAIMAGLLICQLELRGLAERILIFCPANPSFEWQREVKEKFDEKFSFSRAAISETSLASTTGWSRSGLSPRSTSLSSMRFCLVCTRFTGTLSSSITASTRRTLSTTSRAWILALIRNSFRS